MGTLAHPEFMKEIEHTCKTILSRDYMYLGDVEKSREMFRYLVEHTTIDSSRLPECKNGEHSRFFMINHGEIQVGHGILLDMAGERDRARQQFEWAAENCFVDEDADVTISNEDYIARGHLWEGYARLMLGDYVAAYRLFKNVVPHYNKAKKRGTDVHFQKMQYFLPKLLIPLSEYLLSPSGDNRQRAVCGVDDFLASFRDYSEKFDGLLYCLHVEERFPAVYKDDEGCVKALPVSGKRSLHRVLPVEEGEGKHGAVLVIDDDDHFLDSLGTPAELSAYADLVGGIGDFPAILGLIERFGFLERMEPDELIVECKRLLTVADLGELVSGITQSILRAAEEAKAKHSSVALMYRD